MQAYKYRQQRYFLGQVIDSVERVKNRLNGFRNAWVRGSNPLCGTILQKNYL